MKCQRQYGFWPLELFAVLQVLKIVQCVPKLLQQTIPCRLQLLFCLQPANHGEKPPFKGKIADRIYGKCGIICNTLHEFAACLSPHVFTLNIVSSPRSIGRSFLYSQVLGSVKCSSNSSSVLVAEKDQTRCLCYCDSFCLEKSVSV